MSLKFGLWVFNHNFCLMKLVLPTCMSTLPHNELYKVKKNPTVSNLHLEKKNSFNVWFSFRKKLIYVKTTPSLNFNKKVKKWKKLKDIEKINDSTKRFKSVPPFGLQKSHETICETIFCLKNVSKPCIFSILPFIICMLPINA